jgi:hypothetical protein
MTRPRIDSLSQSTVPVNWQGNITIAGDYFTNPSFAKFDGTDCPTAFVDAQHVTATIDANITGVSATLTLRVANNNDEISNDVDFTVQGGAVGAAPPAAPAADAGFGIISSSQYTGTSLEKMFNLGTGRPALVKNVQQNQNYIGVNLRQAVMNCNQNNQVKVIVTVGGNVSALAAAKYSTKPFLSIFGNLTPEIYTSGFLRGGINLDTAARNAERFNHLTQDLGIPANQVCLLSHRDSAMAAAEQDQWTQIFHAGRILVAHDVQTIKNAFQDFEDDGTLTTMIISADPFFQNVKQDIIVAANRSGKQVCYPLQAYSNLGGTARPAPGRHWLHGPKLARAYFELGRDAASVLKDDSTIFDIRTPPMLLDTSNDES